MVSTEIVDEFDCCPTWKLLLENAVAVMAPGFSVPNYFFCKKATIRIADIMRRRASGSIVFEVPPSNLLQTTAERGFTRGNTRTPSEPHGGGGGIRLPGQGAQSQSLVISSVTPAFFRHRSSREAVPSLASGRGQLNVGRGASKAWYIHGISSAQL